MMVGERRAEEPSRTRQYVAGSETRVRPPARQDPDAQQDSGEKCGQGCRLEPPNRPASSCASVSGDDCGRTDPVLGFVSGGIRVMVPTSQVQEAVDLLEQARGSAGNPLAAARRDAAPSARLSRHRKPRRMSLYVFGLRHREKPHI
jgi:hypothetical protein